MRNLISRLLGSLGYTVAKTSHLKKYNTAEIQKLYNIEKIDAVVLKEKVEMTGLKKHLVDSGRTKWLEVGCGGNLEENFVYVDILPEEKINQPGKYFRINMTSPDKSSLDKLGKYDLVRMQHVFEHFTPEEAQVVLENSAYLLKPGGYLLISVPDLKKFIALYLNGEIKDYYNWARERVEAQAPASFYFSVYAHSILTEQHKWCYDAEGLIYLVGKSGYFDDIQELKLGDELSSMPFTHNRPVEDLVVLSRKK
jgi:SAM-dependent methyltransferase